MGMDSINGKSEGGDQQVSLGNTRVVTACAPASVGNVAVGFDVLGHAIQGPQDSVTVERIDEPTISVDHVQGCVDSLPANALSNTAAAAAKAMMEGLDLNCGFSISIDKGIPVSAGMGGSAASAVATVVAINQMLKIPMAVEKLFPFAMQGEFVASGGMHGDNVAASLLGGLVAAVPSENPRPVSINVPNVLRCIVVHPDIAIQTADSRAALPKTLALSTAVDQQANLAGFLAGCQNRDLELIADSLQDIMIEPRRAKQIPGFNQVKAAAMECGAIGCSISGAGPSVFAWFVSEQAAKQAGAAMVEAFASQGLNATAYNSPVNCSGARVVEKPRKKASQQSA